MKNSPAWLRVLNIARPSQMEVLFWIAMSLALVIAALTIAFSHNQYVGIYIDTVKGDPNGAYAVFKDISDRINSSEFAANAAVFTVWAVVGLLGYYVIALLATMERGFFAFFSVISYRTTNKSETVKEALTRLSTRAAALVLLVILANVFIRFILPSLAACFIVGTQQIWWLVLVSFVAGVAIAGVSLHVLVVLMRCIMLRERIFFTKSVG